MPYREPGRSTALAGALVLVVALVAGLALIEFLVDPSHRPVAMRLVAALVLLLVVARIRAFVRASIERSSAWDRARGAAGWVPPFPHSQFEHFHDEIRFSTRSQRYFDHVLWPRLCALARAGLGPAGRLDKAPGRRFGRGPALEALRALITLLERRR